MVAAQFGSALDERLVAAELGPAQLAAVREVKERPLSGGAPGQSELDAPIEAASVHAYRWGMGVGGGLTMLGGVISLIGIVNPRRAAEPQRRESHGPAALHIPCPDRRREVEAALSGAGSTH